MLQTKFFKKDSAFMWGDQQQSSFEELMHVLTSAPVLQMPRFDKPFTIHVDASDVSISAVLTQKVENMDMPVCYYNKRLNETEARWSIYQRELYAIVQALNKCGCCLMNRHTVLYSDHQPPQYFTSQPKLSAKQQCWLEFQLIFQLMFTKYLVSTIF